MSRPERACRSLAMDKELPLLTVDLMLFRLARIVRDVEQQLQSRLRQATREDLADQVGDHLAIGERAVDRGAHGAKVALPEIGADRRAGELPIRQPDAEPRRGESHFAQEIGADLMTQSARATMNRDNHIAFLQAEDLGRILIEDPGAFLDLQVVVARTERPHLATLALLRSRRNTLGIGIGDAAAFLDAVEVVRGSPAPCDRPGGTTREHLVHLERIEGEFSFAAEARGNAAGEVRGEDVPDGFDFRGGQPRRQRPYAARNIEADSPGRDDTALFGREGGDAADRKPIAPVRIRHDIDGLYDAGKRCDVDRLLMDLLVHVTGELLGCVDNDRHPHVGDRGDPPRALRDPLERAQVHDEPICLNVDDALRDPLIAFLADS